MSDTDHSEKPEGKERGERRQRRAGAKPRGQAMPVAASSTSMADSKN